MKMTPVRYETCHCKSPFVAEADSGMHVLPQQLLALMSHSWDPAGRKSRGELWRSWAFLPKDLELLSRAHPEIHTE